MLIRIKRPSDEKTYLHFYCKESIPENVLKEIPNKITAHIRREADSYTGDGEGYINTNEIILYEFAKYGINLEPISWDYDIDL